MTDAAPPEPNPTPPRPPRWRRWRWLLVFGLTSAGVGWIGFWLVLQQYVQPFIERQVGNTLERPVEMGRITRVSLNRIHFGPTRLPVQPDDADHAIAQAVEVRFTPLKIALQRRLELDITLKDSAAYIAEDETHTWLKIPKFEEGNLPIKIRVSAIRIQDATLDLVKLDAGFQPTAPIQLQVERGALLIRDGVKDMGIAQLQGGFVAGGRFTVDGNVGTEGPFWDGLNGKLALKLQDINLAEVARILPPLPLEIRQGEASGNMVMALAGNPLDIDTAPEFTGVARLSNIVVATSLVEPVVTVERGDIRLQGEVAQLDGWRTRLGEIPLRIGGTVSAADTLANRVNVQLEPTAIATLLETFNYEDLLPVPVAGSIALNATLFGPLEQPKIMGRVVNACPELGSDRPAESQAQIEAGLTPDRRTRHSVLRNPVLQSANRQQCELRLDRLPFRSLLADFHIDLLQQRLTLQQAGLQPRAGGMIRAQGGGILKGARPLAQLKAEFAELPADALLSAYGIPLPVRVGSVGGEAQVLVPIRNWRKLQATVVSQVLGGVVQVGNVELTDQQWSGRVIARNLNLPAPLAVRDATANLQLGGRLDRFGLDTFTVAGQAQAQVGQGRLTASRLALAGGQFSGLVEAQNADVGAIAANFLPAQFATLPIGNLNGNLAIGGRLRGGQLPDLIGQGQMNLALAGGTATLQALRLQNNQLTAQAQANQVQLSQAAALIPARLPLNPAELGVVDAAIALQSNLTPLLQGDVTAILQQTNLETDAAIADLSGGQGRAKISLRQGQWQANLSGQNLDLRRLSPQLPASLNQPASGQFQFTGRIPEQFSLNSLAFTGQGAAQLGEGRITVPNVRLSGGRLRAQAQPQNIALHPFHPLLRGRLVGDVNVNIPLQNVTALTATGQVNLDQGVSLITNPLDINFQWGHERLRLDRLHAKDQLTAEGTVDINLARILAGAIGPDVIRDLNLTVDAQNLPLQPGLRDLRQLVTLPVPTEQVILGGTASFNGTVQGNVRSPEVTGNLSLDHFALNRWAFDPLLSGPVSINPNGSTVNLTGASDRLIVALDDRYLPTRFDVQLQELQATGVREGNLLKTTVENVSLRRVKALVPTSLLPPLVAAQPLSGRLTGRFDVNLNTWGIAGQVAISPFMLGPLQASTFTGGVQYVNGAIALEDAELITGDTRYALSGRLIPTGPDPEVQAELEIVQGDIQDILAALEIAQLSDLLRLGRTVSSPATGSAADLDTVAVGDGDAPLRAQLDRLSEILALNRQNDQNSIDALPLPPLDVASGAITGRIS
ncbi:MAG: hypothetical protein ACPGVO_19420, partial [Spirulinaceae cyanobacterium]